MSTTPVASPAGPRSAQGAGGRKLFVLFRIGADRYALAADSVVQVLPLLPLKQLPGAPAWVAGVLVHAGAPVPVIDLCPLATGQPARRLTSTRTVLVSHRHQGLDPVRTLGLVLEGVTETVHRDPTDFVPCGLDSPQARYLGPVRDEPEGMLQWVSVDALLSDEACALLFPVVHPAANSPANPAPTKDDA